MYLHDLHVTIIHLSYWSNFSLSFRQTFLAVDLQILKHYRQSICESLSWSIVSNTADISSEAKHVPLP